jgi:glutaredoxin
MSTPDVSIRLLAGALAALTGLSGCDDLSHLVNDHVPSTEPRAAPDVEPVAEEVEAELPKRPATSTARSETEVITFQSILENEEMTREERIRAFEKLDPAALQKPVASSNVAHGSTTTTDRPHAERAEPSSAELAAARRRVPIVMYSTAWCGVCERARKHFRQAGLPFVEHDVDQDAAARQEYLRLNPRQSVPTIKVGDQLIVGFSAQAVDTALDAAARHSLN